VTELYCGIAGNALLGTGTKQKLLPGTFPKQRIKN